MVPLNLYNQNHLQLILHIDIFHLKYILLNIISGKYSFKKCFLIIIVLLDYNTWICCHSYTILPNFDFSDLDTCFLHSMLRFTFALKRIS